MHRKRQTKTSLTFPFTKEKQPSLKYMLQVLKQNYFFAQENYIKARCTFQSTVRDNQQTTYKALAKCGKRRCRGFLNLNKQGQVKNVTKHKNYLDQQTHFLDRIPRYFDCFIVDV